MVAPPNYWAPLDARKGNEDNDSNEIFDPGKEVEKEMAQVSIENDTHREKISRIQAKWKRKLNNRKVRK